jgi:hypothetical protein
MSKPNNLEIHWCCGIVERRWSNMNFSA